MFLKEAPQKTCAIVGHGATLTLLLCKMLGMPPSFEMDPKKVGCFAEVDWDNRRIIKSWEEY
jgi:broad specificity phosphatase PhoE